MIRARWLLTVTLLLGPAGCLDSTGPPIGTYDTPRTALVLMDLQRDFLAAGGRLPVARSQVPALLENISRLAGRAAAQGWEVVYVVNEFDPDGWIGNWFRHDAALAGTPGAALDPRVPRVSEHVFAKDAPDAFTNPALDAFLRGRQVDHLILAGVFADQCVYWTARGARNREYRVTAARDAVAAADDEDRATGLADLAAAGVRLATTAELLGGELPPAAKEPILPGP